WTKPPFQTNGNGAKSNDPTSWTTFSAAEAAYRDPDNRLDGLSFALTPPIIGIDLDRCIDRETKIVEPWAQKIVDAINSYSEISPSGTGIHILAIGSLPDNGRKKDRIEVYQDRRFLCITGQRFNGTPPTIQNRGPEIRALHAAVFGTGSGKVDEESPADTTLQPTDKKVLAEIFKS